jgi:hypothetical protein
VVSTALYGAATTGQEIALAGSAVTVASVAGLLANLDPAYLDGAKLYCSPGDYAKLVAADPKGLQAFHESVAAVVPTNCATSYVEGTVSGPVLANLGQFMTFRHVDSIGALVLKERYADLAQIGVVAYLRADFQASGKPRLRCSRTDRRSS